MSSGADNIFRRRSRVAGADHLLANPRGDRSPCLQKIGVRRFCRRLVVAGDRVARRRARSRPLDGVARSGGDKRAFALALFGFDNSVALSAQIFGAFFDELVGQSGIVLEQTLQATRLDSRA